MTNRLRQIEKPTDWVTEQLRDPEVRAEFGAELPGVQFATKLERALEIRGMTRSSLAKRVGRSPAFVTQTLRRGRNLTIRTMATLADACGFRLDLDLVPYAIEAPAGMPAWTSVQLVLWPSPASQWARATEPPDREREAAAARGAAAAWGTAEGAVPGDRLAG